MRYARLLGIAVFVLTIGIVFRAGAGQAVVSTMANVPAVSSSRGFYIAPVTDVRHVGIAGDETHPQVFEIIRPRGEAIAIGRLHTSCSCVQLETYKSRYGSGERAFITLRNVRPTPPDGQMYAFYVQIVSPQRATLRYDTFVRSDRFQPRQVYPTTYAPTAYAPSAPVTATTVAQPGYSRR